MVGPIGHPLAFILLIILFLPTTSYAVYEDCNISCYATDVPIQNGDSFVWNIITAAENGQRFALTVEGDQLTHIDTWSYRATIFNEDFKGKPFLSVDWEDYAKFELEFNDSVRSPSGFEFEFNIFAISNFLFTFGKLENLILPTIVLTENGTQNTFDFLKANVENSEDHRTDPDGDELHVVYTQTIQDGVYARETSQQLIHQYMDPLDDSKVTVELEQKSRSVYDTQTGILLEFYRSYSSKSSSTTVVEGFEFFARLEGYNGYLGQNNNKLQISVSMNFIFLAFMGLILVRKIIRKC
ncbi:MAG: hypothetical protein IH840_08430 [Candidatus Heimdallarchaeota archaeon]|nr:hypothetical protein [Candidatus Heimdallarchaeota archaeon]